MCAFTLRTFCYRSSVSK